MLIVNHEKTCRMTCLNIWLFSYKTSDNLLLKLSSFVLGDSGGALDASNGAKTCNILGTVFGIITIIGVTVYYVLLLN